MIITQTALEMPHFVENTHDDDDTGVRRRSTQASHSDAGRQNEERFGNNCFVPSVHYLKGSGQPKSARRFTALFDNEGH